MRTATLVAWMLAGSCRPSHEGLTPPSPLDASWIAQVTREPATFAALVDESSRDGWVAFHRCAFEEAAEAFLGDAPTTREARGRALVEAMLLYEDLARVGDVVWQVLADTWKDHPGVPPGSGLPYVAGLAALERGDASAARSWFDLGTGASDPEVAEACRWMATRAEGGPESDVSNGLVGRTLGHLEARRTGRLDPRLHADGPLVQDRDPQGTVIRTFGDPQWLRTWASVARHRALEILDARGIAEALSDPVPGSDPLSAVIFGPCHASSDCTAFQDVPRSGTALLDDFGMGASLPPTDDADQARRAVRALDARFDSWTASLHGTVSADGRALLDDLALAAVFRSRVLLAEARVAMRSDQPARALTLALLALDLASARQIGPVNHPGLYAVMAEAQLRTGHTREALDALQVLETLLPGLGGLEEAANDLAVLQGIDRYGDSKEN
ncbi:MAG: hypothetical protein JXB39_13380 [Deltaproteobacteria bacterium]|nr:hypothetical protein [Deltaproteobacteria bacterium]